MYTLGIETSCDETSASIVKDGKQVLSNVTASSLFFHKKHGGIVPEIAFRKQLETITEVVDDALHVAAITLPEVGLIGVTDGPGLLGSLLIGISFAKALSACIQKPLIGVNHLYGHIYANFLGACRPSFPLVALVVSGGHTSLFYLKNFDTIELMGATVDDACGEAFDKVAKLLMLGYPGGPAIEKISREGNPDKIRFSCSNTKNQLDFSFSGIKTAVLYYLRDKGYGTGGSLATIGYPLPLVRDIAASFQETLVNTLVKKSLRACELRRVKHLVVAGGVASNNRLRKKLTEACDENGFTCVFPSKDLCTDNAAMIAGLAYQLYEKGNRTYFDLSAHVN